jgi:ComEC/Rec2-related protein
MQLEPVCMAAIGLWFGFLVGGSGLLNVVLAWVTAAFAIAMECWPSKSKQMPQPLMVVGAFCFGLAMSAGVLRFQAQQQSVAQQISCVRQKSPAHAEAHANELGLEAVEGILAGDTQVTSRKNRRFDVYVQAVEYSAKGIKVRCEWQEASFLKRPVFALTLMSGAGERMPAGTSIRAEKLKSADVLWVDERDLKLRGTLRFLARLRAAIAARFASALLVVAGRAGALAQALLLGVKDELDTEFKGLFQSAGCAHMLALSGQHLSIICTLAALAAKRVLHGEKPARRASLVFAWFFVWLAGPGPSLLRAALMLTAAEFGRILDRPQSSFALLSLASLMLALFSPSSITSLSSIYSFAAMAGLVLFAGRFDYALRPYMPARISQAFAASSAAVCATAPVSILVFGTFVPAGILAATIAAPVMLIFMWMGLGAGLLGVFLPIIASMSAPILETLQDVLLAILTFGAWLPALQTGQGMVERALFCAGIVSIWVLIYAVPMLRWKKSCAQMQRMRLLLPNISPWGGNSS